MTEKLLTYALGRGLTAHDMPAVRGSCRGGRRWTVSFLVDGARHRQERAVPDADGASRRKPQLIGGQACLYEDVVAASDVSARSRRDAGAALLDAMVPA